MTVHKPDSHTGKGHRRVKSPKKEAWILANNGGKMERSRLRAATGMRCALLNPILDEFLKEGRIRITVTMKRDIVSLVVGE